MKKINIVVSNICKAVGLGMGAAVVVLGILSVINADTGVAMLGIGLFALALAALQKLDDREDR